MAEQKNLEELFKLIKDKINLESKEAGFSEHNLTSGEIREDSLRGFLINLLPKFFKYGNGKLIDFEGTKSSQQDIIIYSPYISILTPGSKLFPIDSVFATIEVKTNLDKNKLEESMKNIASVKRLKKALGKSKIQCNIFAHSSDSNKTIMENLKKIKENFEIEDDEMFDNLCINGRCLITKNNELKSLSKPSEDYDYLLMDLEEKSLPYFLDSMINTMDFSSGPTPIFTKYLGEFKFKCQEWKLK
ncbi:hypothetical protein K9L16_03010 [Candidatus Pacearchaeota archaeon]|nr:hypothetical protein [Candidatus Pacearchaeota archaeon]